MATATRPPTQTGNKQAGYGSANEQAQTTALDVTRRLQAHHFALSNEVSNALVAQGIPAHKLPMLASACVAVNVPPNLLRYSHNIPPIIRIMNLVTEYGYRAGEDFFVSVFKSKVPVLNEDGEPTDQKADAPTIVVMPSAARALENMKNDDRLNGVIHHIEAEVIEDRGEAKKVFDLYAGKNYVWGDDVAVARASLYAYFKNGIPLGSGKPLVFYGFFLPKFYYHDKDKDKTYVNTDWNEAGKPKPNYGPGDIAMKRAETKAARHVTKTNYARDNRTADQRLAALVSQAATRLTEAEQDADDFGVDVETALADRESLHKPLPEGVIHTVNGLQEEEDGDALFMASEPAKPKAKPAQAPQPPMDFSEVAITEDGEINIPRASDAQLEKLHSVGRAIHGEAWELTLFDLVDIASNGAANVAEDLTPGECNEVIIDILGNKVFGEGWPAQVKTMCEKTKKERLAQLDEKSVASIVARLEKKLFEVPA